MPWGFQSRRKFDSTYQTGDQRQFGLPVTGHSQTSATGRYRKFIVEAPTAAHAVPVLRENQN